MKNTDTSDKSKDNTEAKGPTPGRVRRFARGAGRVAIFPLKNTLNAPRNYIFNSEYVWSWSQWRSMASTLSPKARIAAIEALGEDEQWWADPARWPDSVRGYMLMNMQSTAMIYLGLMLIAVLAVVRGGMPSDLSPFARISFFTGGAASLVIAAVLYGSSCIDYQRLYSRMTVERRTLAKQPETYWPFDADTSFGSFVRTIPGHVRLAWQMRARGSAKARSAIASVLRRAAVAVIGLVVAFAILFAALHAI